MCVVKKREGDNKMTTFERDYKDAKEGNGMEVLKFEEL